MGLFMSTFFPAVYSLFLSAYVVIQLRAEIFWCQFQIKERSLKDETNWGKRGRSLRVEK